MFAQADIDGGAYDAIGESGDGHWIASGGQDDVMGEGGEPPRNDGGDAEPDDGDAEQDGKEPVDGGDDGSQNGDSGEGDEPPRNNDGGEPAADDEADGDEPADDDGLTPLSDYVLEPLSAGETGVPDTDWYTSNPSSGTYTISTADELAGLAALVNDGADTFNGKTITLGMDVDLSVYGNPDNADPTIAAIAVAWNDGKGWVPIGKAPYDVSDTWDDAPFSGIFDGNGHTVKGLYIDETEDADRPLGLFGLIDSGTVKSLRVPDADIKAAYTRQTLVYVRSVGGITGTLMGGVIEDCYVGGSISGTGGQGAFTGGVVGWVAGSSTYSDMQGGRVERCRSSATVIGGDGVVGGVVGTAEGSSVTDCHSTGGVSGLLRVGGVVGSTNSSVTDCSSAGDISGFSVGGVVCMVSSGGNVTRSWSTGNISGGDAGAAGVAAQVYYASVTDCYSTGNVSATAEAAAGGVAIFVNNGSIANCYSTGNISGTGSSGGVAVEVNDGSVSGSYSTGSVRGRSAVGGVVGEILRGDVTGSYAIGTVTGTGFYVGGVVGRVDYGNVTSSYATGSVRGNWAVGGVVGIMEEANVRNCAALGTNVSVTQISGGGRVAGVVPPGNRLSGNVAFSGMRVTQGGSAKHITDSATGVDGRSRSKSALQSASAFPAVFMDDPWTYAPGRLPGLGGESASMPNHLYSGPVRPAIITASLPGGALGVPYGQSLSATGGRPIEWSVADGVLPDGLTLSATGRISGTPTATGTFTFSVRAANAGDRDTRSFSITVGETISIFAIEGIDVPVLGGTPAAVITETAEYTGAVQWAPRHVVFGYGTAYTATVTLTPKAGFTFVGMPADSFTVAGAVSVSNAAGSGVARAVFPATEEKIVTTLGVSPSQAMLTPVSLTASFAGSLPGVDESEHGRLAWSLADETGAPLAGAAADILSLAPETGIGTTVTATAGISGLDGPQKALLRAEFDGRYVAFATLDIVPNVSDGSLAAQALETRVTVNTAKEIGALLPVRITGDRVLAVELWACSSSGAVTGTAPLEGYAAVMDGGGRHVAISGETGVAKSGRAVLRVSFAGGGQRDTGMISLTVRETYPKITLRAERLNLFYRDGATRFTATANDGSRVDIVGLDYANDAARGIVEIQESGDAKINEIKAVSRGTARVDVTLNLDGYHKATSKGDVIRGSVQVVDTLPRLRLSRSSIPLFDNGGVNGTAIVMLQSNQRGVGFDEGYTVTGVTAAAAGTVVYDDLDAEYKGSGAVEVTPKAGARNGTAVLRVSFAESDRTVSLRLRVNMVAQNRLRASARPGALTVNVGQAGHISDVEIVPNAANLVLGDWRVRGTNPLDGAVDTDFSAANRIGLSVNEATDLGQYLGNRGANKRHTLNIESPTMPSTFIKLNITITQKAQGFSLTKPRGRIDIAVPGGSLTSTVRLGNVSSGIASVTLYEQRFVGSRLQVPSAVSGLFEVADIVGNAITVKAIEGVPMAPNVSHRLSVLVRLENGEELRSWTVSTNSSNVTTVKDKPLTVRPVQAKAKGWRSRSAVTLYTAVPASGERIGLALTSPAGVTLSEVGIAAASLKPFAADDGFRLERSGEGEWTIFFAKNRVPALAGRGSLKSSYTVRVELWAEGTYALDGAGRPVALVEGKARSRPTVVSVRVNVR